MQTSLTIDDDGDPPHQVLWPRGDIEASNAAVFRQSLAEVDTSMHLIIVLNDVPFMDSAGLGALISGMRDFRESGARLIMSIDKPALARLIGTTGLDRTTTVTSSYAQALQVLRSDPA